jgi:protein arginine kinase activator
METTCDCCPNPAVVHETVIRNGVKSEVHLCADHARERGYPLPSVDSPSILVSKLMQQLQTGQPATPSRTVKTCPSCGGTMASVRETGLVGCPLCYRHFEDELGAIITRAQAGANVHVGRHPAHASDLVDRAAMRNRLARELREAVAREEYERAARLRDKLQELGGGPTDAFADDSESDASATEGGFAG